MSREFGSECGGFFHNKLQGALEDASGGTSNGAKLMAAILAPLANIAYDVSSEEAGDASESGVIDSVHENLEAIERAVSGLQHFIAPARELAAKVLADTLRPLATVKAAGDGRYTITIPCRRMVGATWEVQRMAICQLAPVAGCRWQGSHWVSHENHETHTVGKYGTESPQELQSQIADLKNRLAYLEAVASEVPA